MITWFLEQHWVKFGKTDFERNDVMHDPRWQLTKLIFIQSLETNFNRQDFEG